MAISLRGAGNITSQSSAEDNCNPAYPSGLQSNDISILTVSMKAYNTVITTPSGWTKIAERTSGTRATGTPDRGSVKVAMYYRIGAFSGGIGNIGLSAQATDCQAVINSYQCGAGDAWDVTFTDGAQTSLVNNYSATGAADLDLASGDWLLVGCSASDVQGDGHPTNNALTASGSTFGTLTVRSEDYNFHGWNIWTLYWDRPVTGGSSNGPPVQTWTWGHTQEGASIFVRLRAAPASTPKSDADTGTGTDSAGTVRLILSGSDTASGTDDSALSKPVSQADTAAGTDTVASRLVQGADVGTSAESDGKIVQPEPITVTESSGTVKATLTTTAEPVTSAEAATRKTMTEADSGSASEAGGMVTQPRSGSETVTGTEDDYLIIKKTGSDTAGSTDAHTNRRFDGQSDNPTTNEGQTQSVLLPQNKAGSDTSGTAEGQTRLQPGQFSQIPAPKVWTNGDDLDAGTLNKEWRDTFNWMLRGTAPAFSGYNADGAALTYTNNAAIPIKVEELKRGNVQHATNDSKVFVYESGVYLIKVGIGVIASGITGGTGTNLSSVLKVNGVVQSVGDTTRAASPVHCVQHMVSQFLNAGDYVEIALGGSWTGTATAVTTSNGFPYLILWWRGN